ncbi:MAG: hypothetical protein Q7I94_00935, partial [Candidatus Contubernalis sp.]|nr:hypothetical protein [Candidatus Contubernalis sp.]
YNGKIRHIEILPQADTQVQVRIVVDVKDDFYHLATIERKDFWQEGKDYLWVLTDHKGKIIEEVILGEKVSEDTEENDEEEEEQGTEQL